jgi:hypothetical protein
VNTERPGSQDRLMESKNPYMYVLELLYGMSDKAGGEMRVHFGKFVWLHAPSQGSALVESLAPNLIWTESKQLKLRAPDNLDA